VRRVLGAGETDATTTANALYGLLAEFANPDALVAAAGRVRDAGYRDVDAYTPFPVEGLADALELRHTGVPPIFLIAGIVGGLSGYLLQYWVSVSAYPLNVGGRPLNSILSFVPVTFELTILFAALAGVIGMLALDGLPRPYHPVFNVSSFARATRGGFFLLIESRDPLFRPRETRQLLFSLGAREVQDVRE
jgi:hypothetical protein